MASRRVRIRGRLSRCHRSHSASLATSPSRRRPAVGQRGGVGLGADGRLGRPALVGGGLALAGSTDQAKTADLGEGPLGPLALGLAAGEIGAKARALELEAAKL
jgi:hypothetical protein